MDTPDSSTPERQIPFDLLELPRVSRWERWGRWFRKYGMAASSSLGCLTLLVLFVAPVSMQTKKSVDPSIRCLSNVKQMGMAVSMYSQDYDERYMPKAHWMDSMLPYVKNEGVFLCPELDNVAP